MRRCASRASRPLFSVAVIVDQKFIAYKHVANGAYPATAFVLAGALAHLPVALLETLIYSSIVYFMAVRAYSAMLACRVL